MTDQPCLEVPFDEVEKWEKIQGSCARLYAAAEWGYKKGLKEQRSIALRKLADQIAPTEQNYEEAPHKLATVFLNGVAYAANEMRLIATELEAPL